MIVASEHLASQQVQANNASFRAAQANWVRPRQAAKLAAFNAQQAATAARLAADNSSTAPVMTPGGGIPSYW